MAFFTPEEIGPLQDVLTKENRLLKRRYPGPSHERQPVHTVYGGAHLFRAGTIEKLSEIALQSLKQYAPTSAHLAKALGLPWASSFAETIYQRVLQKLKHEAVEDFRIDFEDGYGIRSHQEEDDDAKKTAQETASAMKAKTLPPFIGIRIKSFSEESFERGARTLDIFMSRLLQESGGLLPKNFVVTLPKTVLPEQVSALRRLLEILESKTKLAPKALQMEIMVESPRSLMNASGTSVLASLVEAADGRCRSVHFGTYDYTAACQIVSDHQSMRHPSCDFARQWMQSVLAETEINLSDGATSILPVPLHKPTERNKLSSEQLLENESAVHRAWKLSYADIQHSLQCGFYQGWDLHPAQLPVRYAAVYAFFLENLSFTTERLKSFVDSAARARLSGSTFDDAATAHGLLHYFSRGLNCGALTESDIQATGLSSSEIHTYSFSKIIEKRKSKT